METILTFLLKVSVGTAMLYLVYFFSLRKETFYRVNRWYLILSLLIAVLLPLFPVSYTVFVESGSTSALTVLKASIPNVHPESIESGGVIGWENAVLYIYLTGAVIFLLRLLSQSVILIHLIIKNRIKYYRGVRIVENEKYGLPFSFFKIVFINPKFHKQDDLPEILAHEKVHIRENHWFDLLIIELLTVIFWFNPFIWLFERAIKQNHEYLADRGVISGGHEVGRYQAILVNQLMGMQIIGVTNNLNFAINANRLKMMTKQRTPKIKRAKLLWSLPVLAMLLFAFAEPDYRIKNSELGVQNKVTKSVKVTGKVTDENGKAMPGVSVLVKGTTVGTVSNKDGEFNLELPENRTVVLSFVGKKTIEVSYSDIVSGTIKKGTYFRKYKMETEVVEINPKLSDEEIEKTLIPITRETNTPPPPSPAKKNGKPVIITVEDKPAPVKKPVFFVVEEMPEYKGGEIALKKYVDFKQKKIAELEGIKGSAMVSFVINEKGKVSDIKVMKQDNDAVGKAAAKLVSEMPDWTPGKQRGKAVPVKFSLKVEFR